MAEENIICCGGDVLGIRKRVLIALKLNLFVNIFMVDELTITMYSYVKKAVKSRRII